MTQWHHRCQSDAGNQMNRLKQRDLRTIGHTSLLLIGAKAACVDAAEMTLTERGRTMWRATQFQSFNATISSSKQRRRTSLCKAISAIDSVYNRTMALECEFKGLSDQAVPKYLPQVVRVQEGTGARRSRRSSQQCFGPRNRWTVRVDTETVTSQGQTSIRACGTVPCDSRGADAYLAKRCGEEVRCIFASASSDSGMARQTLCVVT